MELLINSCSVRDIYSHLLECDQSFIPPLSKRVNILEYSQKLHSKATTIEIVQNEKLIGLIAAYLNKTDLKIGFISNISVLPSHKGLGYGKMMLKYCVQYMKSNGVLEVHLEVDSRNSAAIHLYKALNFYVTGQVDEKFLMKRIF